MTNSRRRKNAKEYARGFAAGEENRSMQSREWRPNIDSMMQAGTYKTASDLPYARGFRAGRAIRQAKAHA